MKTIFISLLFAVCFFAANAQESQNAKIPAVDSSKFERPASIIAEFQFRKLWHLYICREGSTTEIDLPKEHKLWDFTEIFKLIGKLNAEGYTVKDTEFLTTNNGSLDFTYYYYLSKK